MAAAVELLAVSKSPAAERSESATEKNNKSSVIVSYCNVNIVASLIFLQFYTLHVQKDFDPICHNQVLLSTFL